MTPAMQEHLLACARLEQLRDRGYNVRYFGVPYFNSKHEHFHVTARLYQSARPGYLHPLQDGWGVTLAEAVDRLITKLPPDIRDAMMGVTILPKWTVPPMTKSACQDFEDRDDGIE